MIAVVVIVLGMLVGAATGEGFGALAGAAIGWLAHRSWRQERALAALRVELAAVLRAGAASEPSPVAASTLAEPAPTRLPIAPSEVAEAEPGLPTVVDAVVAPTPTPTATPTPRPTSAPTPTPTPTPVRPVEAPASAAPTPVRPARPLAATRPQATASAPAGRHPLAALSAWFFGGNTIVKAGVAILFVGLAFLAKYAAEHTQVPIEWRLAGIGAAALALLAVGWRLRASRPSYAQVLQGGAVAVLYLVLFAAFRLYGVLALGAAFALMVAVAGLAAALAVLQDAPAMAVMGALGGFATPLLLSSGGGNVVALFTYYLVLDLGIAAIAWFKTWRALNLIGFFFTFVVATAWGVLRYRPEDLLVGEGFLIAFFLVFVAILLLPTRRLGRTVATASQPSDAWVSGSLLFGLPTVVFALQYGLVADIPFATALSALVLAAFYVVVAMRLRGRPDVAIGFDASLAVATVFLTLVVPFALDERSTAGAWTLEAAGLVWIGFRQQRVLPRVFGYGLFLLSAASMLFGQQRHGLPTALFNAYLFNGLMAAVAALAAALFVHRGRGADAPDNGEEAAEPLLVGLATLWLALTAALQIAAFVPADAVPAAVLVAASAVAVVYAVLASWLRWPQIALPAALHAPLLLLVAGGQGVLLADPFGDGGGWAWPLAFAAHAAVLRRAAPFWPRPIAHGVHALGAVVLALVGALAGRALTAGWGDDASAWPWLGWLIVPAALLLVLPRPASVRLWPMRALPDAYRATAAAVIGTGLWLWTLLANVASDGTAAPLPYVPLLNPLDVGIGVALVAVYGALRSAAPSLGATLAAHPAAPASGPAPLPALPPWLVGALALAGFLWLNGMLVRAFHHYGDVPYRLEAWSASLAVQTGITLLWSAIALVAMWLGARSERRVAWLAGAVLLGAVVLKLLVVDLSGSGTVARIVSFIGVGLLMLVIGYVAPLPGREARRAAL